MGSINDSTNSSDTLLNADDGRADSRENAVNGKGSNSMRRKENRREIVSGIHDAYFSNNDGSNSDYAQLPTEEVNASVPAADIEAATTDMSSGSSNLSLGSLPGYSKSSKDTLFSSGDIELVDMDAMSSNDQCRSAGLAVDEGGDSNSYLSADSTGRPRVDKVQQRHQLHSLNLEIHRGELVAVVGAVGAGKSSLFSALLGK